MSLPYLRRPTRSKPRPHSSTRRLQQSLSETQDRRLKRNWPSYSYKVCGSNVLYRGWSHITSAKIRGSWTPPPLPADIICEQPLIHIIRNQVQCGNLEFYVMSVPLELLLDTKSNKATIYKKTKPTKSKKSFFGWQHRGL